MNAFYLAGRIIDTPEKLESANGTKICRLKIAVEKNIKEANDVYEIFEITLFRNLAQESFETGQLVAVNGRLQANNYEKDGNLYYNVKLIGNSVTFVGN